MREVGQQARGAGGARGAIGDADAVHRGAAAAAPADEVDQPEHEQLDQAQQRHVVTKQNCEQSDQRRGLRQAGRSALTLLHWRQVDQAYARRCNGARRSQIADWTSNSKPTLMRIEVENREEVHELSGAVEQQRHLVVARTTIRQTTSTTKNLNVEE